MGWLSKAKKKLKKAVKSASKSVKSVSKKLLDPKEVAKQAKLLVKDPSKAHKNAWTEFKNKHQAMQQFSIGAKVHDAIAKSDVGEALNIRSTEEKWTSEGQQHTVGAIGAFLGGGVPGVLAFKAADIASDTLKRKAQDELEDAEDDLAAIEAQGVGDVGQFLSAQGGFGDDFTGPPEAPPPPAAGVDQKHLLIAAAAGLALLVLARRR